MSFNSSWSRSAAAPRPSPMTRSSRCTFHAAVRLVTEDRRQSRYQSTSRHEIAHLMPDRARCPQGSRGHMPWSGAAPGPVALTNEGCSWSRARDGNAHVGKVFVPGPTRTLRHSRASCSSSSRCGARDAVDVQQRPQVVGSTPTWAVSMRETVDGDRLSLSATCSIVRSASSRS